MTTGGDTIKESVHDLSATKGSVHCWYRAWRDSGPEAVRSTGAVPARPARLDGEAVTAFHEPMGLSVSSCRGTSRCPVAAWGFAPGPGCGQHGDHQAGSPASPLPITFGRRAIFPSLPALEFLMKRTLKGPKMMGSWSAAVWYSTSY